MKILITDILTRKTFDTVNILTKYYKNDDLIFTCNNFYEKFIALLVYKSTNIFKLRKSTFFQADLVKISKILNDQKIIYIPFEEDTTILFFDFIKKQGDLNFKYKLPSSLNFELSRNKIELNKYCKLNNIDIPNQYFNSDIENNSIKFPVIVKPRSCSGSKGIKRFKNLRELRNFNFDEKTFVCQELLNNSINVEAGFFLMERGEIISYYSHKRLRTYPENGGVSVLSKSTENLYIKKIGHSILKKMNWNGFAMIEFIYDDKTNLYKLIEINPRLWGSVLLSEFCNSNFLDGYIRCCLNKNIVVNQIDTEKYVRWIFPYDIIYWFKNLSNPLIFFKKQNNTCYINFSYSNTLRSMIFIIFSYFNLKKIIAFFK